MIPNEKQIRSGVYKMVDGVWHKLCTGPAHESPEYLPATEKYFSIRKSDARREGKFLSRCRLCQSWAHVKSPGSHHGLVPAHQVRHFYAEAANRVGLMELSRRTGLNWSGLVLVLNGRTSSVRKANLRKVMLELISMRRKDEHSINGHSSWRVTLRASGGEVCSGCRVPLSRYTDGCSTCWERQYRRGLRTEGRVS